MRLNQKLVSNWFLDPPHFWFWYWNLRLNWSLTRINRTCWWFRHERRRTRTNLYWTIYIKHRRSYKSLSFSKVVLFIVIWKILIFNQESEAEFFVIHNLSKSIFILDTRMVILFYSVKRQIILVEALCASLSMSYIVKLNF